MIKRYDEAKTPYQRVLDSAYVPEEDKERLRAEYDQLNPAELICPELDIASQGYTIEEAKDNLKEAISLFLECASQEEIEERFSEDIYISSVEVAIVRFWRNMALKR